MEHEKSLPHHARSRSAEYAAVLCAGTSYQDATFIDHYNKVVHNAGYVP